MRAFVFASYLLAIAGMMLFYDAAFAQLEPPPPGQPWNTNSNWSARSDERPINFVSQAAEENKDTVIQNVEAMLSDNFRKYNDTYVGLHTFGGGDIIDALCENIILLMAKWFGEAQSIILTVTACIIMVPRRRRLRSLACIGVELICLMVLLGIAFDRNWHI